MPPKRITPNSNDTPLAFGENNTGLPDFIAKHEAALAAYQRGVAHSMRVIADPNSQTLPLPRPAVVERPTATEPNADSLDDKTPPKKATIFGSRTIAAAQATHTQSVPVTAAKNNPEGRTPGGLEGQAASDMTWARRTSKLRAK